MENFAVMAVESTRNGFHISRGRECLGLTKLIFLMISVFYRGTHIWSGFSPLQASKLADSSVTE